jgi:hypothetical protein
MGDQALLAVDAEIKAVSVKLEEVEEQIKQARAQQDKMEVAALRKEKEQLRTEKEQLRDKEKRLHTDMKELLLLERLPGHAGAPSSCVPHRVVIRPHVCAPSRQFSWGRYSIARMPLVLRAERTRQTLFLFTPLSAHRRRHRSGGAGHKRTRSST